MLQSSLGFIVLGGPTQIESFDHIATREAESRDEGTKILMKPHNYYCLHLSSWSPGLYQNLKTTMLRSGLRSASSRLAFTIRTIPTRRGHGSFLLLCLRCLSASTPSAPPLLPRLREDLKTAMRTKDTPRLAVLRAIIADITNSTKTHSPISDDISLLSLLKKRISASRAAVEEFCQADRKDLVAKEEEQLRILDDYASKIRTMDAGEIRGLVIKLVESLRSDSRQLAVGDVM